MNLIVEIKVTGLDSNIDWEIEILNLHYHEKETKLYEMRVNCITPQQELRKLSRDMSHVSWDE